MKKLLSILLLAVATLSAHAQVDDYNNGFNQIDPDGNITNAQNRKKSADSLGTDKEIPEGIYVWKIDRRFGDRIPAQPDTLTDMFQNTIFTTGLRGEYNSTGNLGAPRQNRIFVDRKENDKFIFVNPYDYFVTPVNNAATENDIQQNQTSLAMQSILSGQLSQQINNILSSVVNSSNWNFGANISTGDEGWNNAEYEGLVSGRLFNNRLLFNGQFGYRDNATATTSFIGDFDLRYLLKPNGNFALRVYNQTNDRYFTRNSLNTQGAGSPAAGSENPLPPVLP